MKTNAVNENLANETLQTIFSRRAVRKYLPDMVAEDILNKILDAGLAAPSAMKERIFNNYHR